MSRRREDELKRRRFARLRFRNLIRSTIANKIWLLDAEEQKLSLNVKKNIAMVVRPHRKIGILTMAEKSLICTKHFLRKIEDRKKLVTLLSGLMCFSAFPPKVRARLVPVINYMMVEPGRLLIKEGAMPQMVYFILYGEVEIYKKVYNHIERHYTDEFVCVLGPGDCIGELELIENYKQRKNSCTTTTTTELLYVYEKDFQRILLPVMNQQWMDKKTAIRALRYFDYFNEEQISSACKFGLLRQFDPLDTIFHEDRGLLSYAHFVTSGECMILQCLKVKVKQKDHKRVYELVELSKDESDTIFQDLTNKELMKMLKEEAMKPSVSQKSVEVNVDLVSSKEGPLPMDSSKTSFMIRKRNVEAILKSCGIIKDKEQPLDPTAKEVETISGHESSESSALIPNQKCEECNDVDSGNASDKSLNALIEAESQEEFIIPALRILRSRSSLQPPGKRITQSSVSLVSSKSQYSVKGSGSKGRMRSRSGDTLFSTRSLRLAPDSESESSAEITVSGSDDIPSEQLLQVTSMKTNEEAEVKIENHFIDVGSIMFGGIFGLGERCQHRVIMARTTVQCLMLPRFWLLEKDQNPGNIWQRRRFYLDCTIPSRQTLYDDFLTTLKWKNFKKDLVKQSLHPIWQLNNPTKVQDIPIICRIMEGPDEN